MFINIFLGMPCLVDPNSYSDVDPSTGTLCDTQGKPVASARVLQTEQFESRSHFAIFDSSLTSNDGTYKLINGVPNHYTGPNGGFACSSNKVYDKMETFWLVFIHPSYDTTIVLFIDSPTQPINSGYYRGVDTVFTQAGTSYGAVGSLRHMPTIIMRSKK